MKYLIQNACPDFTAPALLADGKFTNQFRLSEHFAGQYGVLFFFPLDFNYISLTELLSINKRLPAFKKLNAEIVAISCDSYLAHRAWQLAPRTQEGLGPIGFPMVADMTRHISHLFDVLVAEAMPEAATIIVDRENKVIFQLRHDTAIGRNVERILEAITIFQDAAKAPTAPVEQILLLEKNAPRLKQMGYNIVAQSVDTDLDHPQWKLLPRDSRGGLQLSFPFLSSEHEWPTHKGMTIAVREGLQFHSTGLLQPDGQLLFEHHSDRQVPRDFTELLRIADSFTRHLSSGEVITWEKP